MAKPVESAAARQPSRGILKQGLVVSKKSLALWSAYKLWKSGMNANEVSALARSLRRGDVRKIKEQARLHPTADGVCSACKGAVWYTDKFCGSCGRRLTKVREL